ncbi:hypothetical protein EV175_006358 [Coemansia sp. RSA 1933]|nr:hypothetical protein EV175_006358 [Coemansia sp. RSA 1933]
MYKSSCLCCCSNLAPQPSSYLTSTQYHHSRSSSASTIVEVSSMLVPRMSPPSSIGSISSSPGTGPVVAITIAIHSDISPHKAFSLSASPPHDSGVGIPDMFHGTCDDSDDVSICSDDNDDEIDGSLFGDDFSDSDQQQPIFDMDADKLPPGVVARSPSVCFQQQPKSLDPADLTYHHTTKPQPWAVRPLDVYNSHRAQIRAIDDDDNAFYPS